MDFIHLWRDDRALSKILCSTSLSHYMAFRLRSRSLNVLCLIFTVSVSMNDLNHVSYEKT